MKIENKLSQLGWHKFKDDFGHPSSECSYQTCIRGDHGQKLYYVTCVLYNFAGIKNIPRSLSSDLQPTFEAQFHLKSGEFFDVQYCGKDVDKALEFFSNLFIKMDCISSEEM